MTVKLICVDANFVVKLITNSLETFQYRSRASSALLDANP